VKIAINGFGRIGRLVYRIIALEHTPHINVVAINDLVPSDNLAYLLKYDSVQGRPHLKIESQEGTLIVNGHKIKVYNEKDPLQLPWKELGVDCVVEASGHFTSTEEARKHIDAGAKRVVITAPGKGDMPTFVMGVNHEQYNPKTDTIV